MDNDWKANLNQIVDLHEHATECSINKSMSSFQSLGITLNRENVCCFFDVLSSRMVETCKKVQMAYLSSMDTVQMVEESPPHGNILISVTSTPQCDSKEHSNIVTMDEGASTEDDDDEEQSLPLDETDASQTDSNKLPDNATTTDQSEASVEKVSDNHDNEELNENVFTNQTSGVNDEPPVNEEDSKTIEEAAVKVVVDDGIDRISTQMDMSETETRMDEMSETSSVSLITTNIVTNLTTSSVTTAAPSTVSVMNKSENDLTAITTIDSPSSSPNQKSLDYADVDVNVDNEGAAENESPSNQDEQITVNHDPLTVADNKEDATEASMPQHIIPTDAKNNDNDSSMETDDDVLYIDTSDAQLDDDVTMTDVEHSANTESTNERKIDDIEIAAASNTDAVLEENKSKIPSANLSPVMSPYQSPPSTPTPSPIQTDQLESTQHSVNTDYNAEIPVDLNPSEQQLSEQEPSDQDSSHQESCQQEPSEQGSSSQYESSEMEPSQQYESSEQSQYSTENKPPTAMHTDTEPKLVHHSEFEHLHGENSDGKNMKSECDGQLLLDSYEKAATQMIENSLKRKDLAELDIACSAVKKYKQSQELENFTPVFPVKDPNSSVEQPNQAFILTPSIPHEFAIPKNTNPNVHCKNALYLSRCLICNQIDPSLINHYRIAHSNSDVFISRPSPTMVKDLKDKGKCTIFKDGKINAFCYFCENNETMSEMEWRNHLMAHTGELEFYCRECHTQWAEKVQHGNCSIESMTSVFDGAAAAGTADCNSAMMLVMCKWCNYVQVHKAHIVRHLQNEHNNIDINFNRNIQKVTFIQDMKPITWNLEPHFKFVPENKRFRCGYPKCTTAKNFREFSDLEHHLNDRHSNEIHNFTCQHCNKVFSLNQSGRQAFRSDLLKHFRLHGGLIAECFICNRQYEGQFKIVQHMVIAHPTEAIRYRSITIEENNDIEKLECTMQLKCVRCDVRVESVTKAIEHFMLEHKSLCLDFNTMKMVKRTKDDTTSCFTPNERKVYNCSRKMVCNTCDLPIKSKDMIEHFNRGHPNQEIMLRPGPIYVEQCRMDDRQNDYVNFSENLVFYCTHCHDNWKAGESNHHAYDCIESVHKHWEWVHSTMTEFKPFHFYAVEFVLCVHCKFVGSFDAVKQHSKELHPNELLTISQVSDAKACALCPYVGDDLGQHIKIEHELILRTDKINPTRFTDNTLKRLLNEYVHTKYKCDHCDSHQQLFETKALAQTHSTMKHPTEQFKFTKCTDDSQIKLIAGCCEATLELHEFLDHLADRNHQVLSVCKCSFNTSDLFEFVNHQVEVHQITKDANLLYRRLMLTKFWSTKVIFGNGLVTTKYNLLGTEYDDSKPFQLLIEKLLTVSRERLHFNQMQKK